ncbi:hypothetical protein [Pedobacter duraquae]|uniref:Uncharacterized protein n=1 Tax=Pedobacter duraquae TaxID=425511 RepID=A0A4R6IM21_9SPHI|nr:hypothetical protein [Pedobacter duraquae]TDO23219.1 hypothetical protein CLV32_2208 [Pedobacter duraquae]
MQDKEFDQLFKDRFEEAEIQPSPALWGAIQAEITPVSKRRAFPGWWMAAAVVLVGVSAGLLFNKTEKIQLQGKAVVATATEHTPITVTADQSGKEVSTGTDLSLATKKNNSLATDNQMDNKVLVVSEEKSLITVQPNEGLSHPLHIGNETLAKVDVGTVKENTNTDIAIASADIPATTVDAVVNENDQAEHTRIRNVGDLINFVVDKVDKREQKFLQFKSDGDDNSSLIAINIGPFKLNPRKHK